VDRQLDLHGRHPQPEHCHTWPPQPPASHSAQPRHHRLRRALRRRHIDQHCHTE
jgi:hypothetical protein